MTNIYPCDSLGASHKKGEDIIFIGKGRAFPKENGKRNLDAFDKAERMVRGGSTVEEIWQETARLDKSPILVTPEGYLYQEVDDGFFSYLTPKNDTMDNHIFGGVADEYDLSRLSVVCTDKPLNFQGAKHEIVPAAFYDTQRLTRDGIVSVFGSYGKKPMADIDSIIAHEIQHYIDDIEGQGQPHMPEISEKTALEAVGSFGKPADYSEPEPVVLSKEAYWNRMDEVRARNTQFRVGMDINTRIIMKPWLDDTWKGAPAPKQLMTCEKGKVFPSKNLVKIGSKVKQWKADLYGKIPAKYLIHPRE